MKQWGFFQVVKAGCNRTLLATKSPVISPAACGEETCVYGLSC